jgi:serine phosphatase RsbU (regulator of sigma subunit)
MTEWEVHRAVRTTALAAPPLVGSTVCASRELRTAARSLSSDGANGASGDWHDLLRLPMGRLAVVVGDAGGRGAQASPLKRALQGALQRLALAGSGSAEILTCLRGIVEPMDDGLATLVYGVVVPALDSLILVNAGHPPPLLVRCDGSVVFLRGGLSPPLGAPSPTPAVPAYCPLRPGDTLLLYTDGLIEGPGRDVGKGLDRVARVGRDCSGASPDEMCDRLIQLGLDGEAPPDDLTAMAVRLARSQPSRRGNADGEAPTR